MASHPEYLVSVVIPVFNRADLLHSVLVALTQQKLPVSQMEVLICDDGSTEDLSAVIAEFRTGLPGMRYLQQTNKGPAAARNLGTRAASADVVLFLDSDVLPESGLVSSLLSALTENPQWVGAEAAVDPVDGEDTPLWDAPVCRTGGVYLTAAIAYRRLALREVGGFDETFRRAACEDVEIAARLLRLGEIGFVPEARVRHPRRRKTMAMFWKKRQDWRYVLYLAQRHGFIGWPENRTSSPRLRLLCCALITQPAGRLIGALRLLIQSPRDGLLAGIHAVFSWFCGLAAAPELLTATVSESQDYLSASSHSRTVPQRAA